MSDIDDLLSRLPYGTLAQQLGVDEDSARAAAGQAIPALLAGLQAQTANEASAQKLVGALAQHDNDLAAGGRSASTTSTPPTARRSSPTSSVTRPRKSRAPSATRYRLRPSIRAWSRNCSRSSPRSC